MDKIAFAADIRVGDEVTAVRITGGGQTPYWYSVGETIVSIEDQDDGSRLISWGSGAFSIYDPHQLVGIRMKEDR
jgi:hypothetical protein